MDWHWLITPLAGGLIGYITNDVAIRMLFRPYRPIYIGKHRLPLTPGLIPKEKERIAQSVGAAVGEQLFNEEVLSAALTSQEMREKLSAAWDAAMENLLAREEGLECVLGKKLGAEKVASVRKNAADAAARKACEGISGAHLGGAMADAALEKLENRVTASLLGKIKPQLARRIDDMIQEKAPALLEKALSDMAEEFMSRPIRQLIQEHENTLSAARAFFFEHYELLIRSLLARILPAIDLAKVAQDRIAAFEPAELEKVILQLAKTELRAIVWLGAALGLVMGVVSALVNLL